MTRRVRATGLVLLLVLLVVGTGAVGAQEPVEEDAMPAPVSMTLVGRGPWIGPDDRLDLEFRADGATPATLARLILSRPLDDEEPLDRDPDVDPARRALFVGDAAPLVGLTAGPDDTRTLSLRSGPDGDVELDETGIHRLTIQVLDPDGAVRDQTTTPVVATGRGDGALVPLDVAILFEVSVPPTLRPDGTRIDDDDLADLADRVLATTEVPGTELLTVAPRPDTIDALASMSSTVGTEALALLAGRPAIALPYLPVDIDALRDEDLIGLLPEDFARGAATVRDTIGDPVLSVWDPVSPLSPAAAILLARLGTTHVLLDAADAVTVDAGARPGTDPDDEPGDDTVGDTGTTVPELTDPGPFPVAGSSGLLAVIVDDATSQRLGQRAGSGADAGHRVLADLVRTPRSGHRVVLRADGIAASSRLGALLPLLAEDDAPLRLGPLDAVLDGDVDVDHDDEGGDDTDGDDDGATGDDSGGTDDGATDSGTDGDSPVPVDLVASTALLPTDDLTAVAGPVLEAAARLSTFESLLDPGSARGDALRLQLLTTLAAGLDDSRRVASVGVVQDRLAATFDGLVLAGQTDLNLTARRGELPVTIANTNGFPATVLVRVRSDRLAFPEGDVLTVRVDEEPLRLDIAVEALATGSVPVFVELWTPDDQILLDTRQLNVRSTAISGVGLALSVGALLVLVVWWYRNWRKSRTRSEA